MWQGRRIWTYGFAAAGTGGPEGERRAVWLTRRSNRRGKEALERC